MYVTDFGCTFSHDGAFIEVGAASLVVLQHLLLFVVPPLLLYLRPCLMMTLFGLGGKERERERRDFYMFIIYAYIVVLDSILILKGLCHIVVARHHHKLN